MSLDKLYAGLRFADVHEDLYRNIVSLRKSVDLFDDLSPNRADWDSAIAVEMQVKQTIFTSTTPIIHRPFEEAIWFSAIGYPYKKWMESRYSDGTFGIWYGASDIHTSAYETVCHWIKFLSDAGNLNSGVKQERQIYLIQCDALLLDFRPLVTKFPKLISKADYSFTQQIGTRLHREEHPGLVTKSARYDGDVYAILNSNVLSNPRHSCFLTYKIRNKNMIDVERTPGTLWFSIPI